MRNEKKEEEIKSEEGKLVGRRKFESGRTNRDADVQLTQEEIISMRWITTYPEDFDEIVELSEVAEGMK